MMKEKQAKRLIWSTWLKILLVGLVVAKFTNPHNYFVLGIAAVFVAYTVIRFWRRRDDIPISSIYVTPRFLMTMFFSLILALVFAIGFSENIFNSYSLGALSIAISCVVPSIVESRYADYDWNKKGLHCITVVEFFNMSCIRFQHFFLLCSLFHIRFILLVIFLQKGD